MSEVVIQSKFLGDFTEIERLVMAYQACIREEGREDIVRDLSGKILAAKEKVLRAEEAGREFLEEIRAHIIGARYELAEENNDKAEDCLFAADKKIYERLTDQLERRAA
jgi:hypothetical protein